MKGARLLTIPFSHYCEKARWGLDHAGVRYDEEGHVPGFHRLAVRRARSRHTSVPVLVVGGRTLGDSSEILAYADTQAPADRKLFPGGEGARAEVLALEDMLDEELGPHIRRVMYFYLLPARALIFGLMDQRTPLWERATLRAAFPLLRYGMRRFMSIDARTAEESRDRTLRVFDEVDRRLAGGRRYLVGDRFGAADLTLASLAGPAVLPEGHFVRFPDVSTLPEPAVALLREIETRPIAEYLRRMYREHRGRATA
jgi:glutathione S-transferase